MMDIKVLRNALKIAQLGSLTYAADEANVTVQALAAQLNKLEEHCGFKLFERSNKGVTLTPAGEAMIPYIMNVVKTAEQLQWKIGQMRKSAAAPLRIALNSTFSLEINQRIMDVILDRLNGRALIFSSSESPDNIAKITKGEVDMAVVIGDSIPDGYYALSLLGLKIKVVAASSHLSADALIRPLPECAYSACFDRFFAQHRGRVKNMRVYYSGGEQVSVSMIKSLGGIGMVSHRVAEINDLTIFPGFEDFLNVWLIMKQPMLTENDLAPLQNNVIPLPDIPLTA